MFVLGLPRSRTAWFSAFLSQSGIKFYHEGINGCRDIVQYTEKMKGCGDCTTAFCAIDFDRLFPDSKKVIIEKSDDEFNRALEWCEKHYGGDGLSILKTMEERLDSIDGLRVKQSEINNNLEPIWKFLTNRAWDEKYADIKNLNIQVNLESIVI